MNISKKRVCYTSNQNLDIRKLFVHWVTYLLPFDQKRVQMNISHPLLTLFCSISQSYGAGSLLKIELGCTITFSRIKNIIKTKNFQKRIGFKKGKDWPFGWESNSNCFLGQSCNYLNRLSSKRKTRYWSILRAIIW